MACLHKCVAHFAACAVNVCHAYFARQTQHLARKHNQHYNADDLENAFIKLNPDVIAELKRNNALKLFEEHIELFDCLSEETENYKMETFDLVDKGKFLFNVGATDCYMNAVGERIDYDKRVVYCPIKITEKESFYDNYIVGNSKVVYYTQGSSTKESAERKLDLFISENYKFFICAQFPHLGYSSSAYFNLGNVKISNPDVTYNVERTKTRKEIYALN